MEEHQEFHKGNQINQIPFWKHANQIQTYNLVVNTSLPTSDVKHKNSADFQLSTFNFQLTYQIPFPIGDITTNVSSILFVKNKFQLK